MNGTRHSLLYFKQCLLAVLALTAFAYCCPSALGQSTPILISPKPMQTKLDLGFWGSADYSCSPNEPAYYVGGVYEVRLLVLPDGKRPGEVEYSGISGWTWPEGLVINVDRSSSPTDPFKSSAALRKRMKFEYYVTTLQAMADSLWRTKGKNPRPLFTAPEYHFAFCVPPELAGYYLRVSVEWDHPTYGHLTSDKPCCIKIVTPCSDRARDQAWGSQVTVAHFQGKHEWAVALADSFMAMGWHDFWGLLHAEGSAQRLGRHDDAIRFLDLCFEWNYTITPAEDRPLLTAPNENTRRDYERQRARLVELKNQQQQR